MIARIWRGLTPVSRADDYFEYLKKTGLKDYRSVPGNQGVFVFRRTVGTTAEFLLISLWDSIDAIKSFAGEEPEKARYYPEDKEYLLDCEPTVNHFDLLTILR
jgi:heme-degrading monooxygenase HmoA